MYRIYYGWLPIPLAAIAFIFAITYVVTVCQLIKTRRISRKCYVLLLNRTLGDILSCLAALATCAYVLFVDHVNHDVIAVMENLFIGGFWSAMVSYVALSILKFYSIWKPLDYRRTITMKRCLYLMALSWIIFVIMVSSALMMLAFVEVPLLNEWTACKYETCFRMMLRSRCAIALVVYLFTLIVFALTVMLIKKAQGFVSSFKRKDQLGREKNSRFPLWKLTLNVGTFGGLSFFYVLWCIGLLLHFDHCFFMRNFVELMRLLGIIRCTLLLRVLVDPIISFITDYHIKRGFLSCFHLLPRTAMKDGSMERTATMSEDSTVNSYRPNISVIQTIS